jgi:hypothetical protein
MGRFGPADQLELLVTLLDALLAISRVDCCMSDQLGVVDLAASASSIWPESS